MAKKGIELSLTFMVTIIIALVVFALGIRFVYNLASQTNDIKDAESDKLDKKFAEISCNSNDRVCIGVERKLILRGNSDVFGIKIINIYNDTEFNITVSRPSPSGYTKSSENITNDFLEWEPKFRAIMVERNEEKEMGIGVSVPKDAEQGIYIFDVKVEPYNTLNKIYVEVP